METDSDPPSHRVWHTLIACAVMGGIVFGTLELFRAESRADRVIYDLLIPIAAGMLSYGIVQVLFGRRTIRMR